MLRFKDLFFAVMRFRRRAAHKWIEWMIKRHHWHGVVLDTNTPNAPCLRVKTLVVINQYGQEHVIR